MNSINRFRGRYFFLSSFYSYRGNKTAEHEFQSLKATCSADRQKIWEQITPGKAKKVGNSIKLRSDWNEVKDSIMSNILKEKFTGHLGYLLSETGDVDIEEGNTWHDNYWGNCYCWKCSDIVGLNKLGKMLMQVREELNGTEM